AQDNYANVLTVRKGEIVENIGYIESAWRKVKGAIDSATQAVMNLGVTEGISGQLEDARKEVRERQDSLRMVAQYGGTATQAERDGLALAQSTVQALEDQL